MPTLCDYAVQILLTKDADEKSRLTAEVVNKWKTGEITEVGSGAAPDVPGRPDNVQILPAGKMPKRGAGSAEGRIALLHSIVHIENVAIDLTWDIIVRFTRYNMPKAFYDDFVKIAGDECKHYTLLNNRLKELGSHYGQLPAHAGLWESAQETAHDLFARLAIEHMVHEARGLDVTPKTIQKFKSGGDSGTGNLLEEILLDEITHVTAGQKWFTYLCQNASPPLDPISTFISTVRQNFRGLLKPPFNTDARLAAGMTDNWYLPLTVAAQ